MSYRDDPRWQAAQAAYLADDYRNFDDALLATVLAAVTMQQIESECES